ncbi:hypothetical protein RQP46_008439 [Phenoliferia psychrophenolica]
MIKREDGPCTYPCIFSWHYREHRRGRSEQGESEEGSRVQTGGRCGGRTSPAQREGGRGALSVRPVRRLLELGDTKHFSGLPWDYLGPHRVTGDEPCLPGVFGRHVRASSDPLSRGGAFADDAAGHLDHEPNPFEQSFSGPRHSLSTTEHATQLAKSREPTVNAIAGSSSIAPRRARSTSPTSAAFPRLTPGGVHRLPPFGAIQTPGGDLTNFSWGDSLRTGPLSPALLNGPAHSAAALFDPSSIRTGLTPLAGNVSFPPPSPATAALFAMMTNNTPGTADPALAGGGPRPHEGPNEGNHFEASFARAATDQTSDASGRSSRDNAAAHEYPSHVQGGPMNPAHRSLLATQINGQLPRAIAPQVMHPSQLGNSHHAYIPQRGPYGEPIHHAQVLAQQQQQQHPPAQQLQQYGQQPYYSQPSSGNATANGSGNPQQQPPRTAFENPQQPPQQYGGQNPLYLLSQAQDLSTHNDDAVVAAAALSNLSGPSYIADPMGSMIPATVAGGQLGGPPSMLLKQSVPPSAPLKGKRGGGPVAPPPPPPAAANKRKKAPATDNEDRKPPIAKKGRRGKSAQQDDDLDDMDDPGDEGSMSPQPHNPNETEEEKRKNFLERNRQAALKCRQRKKAWLANLQSKVEILTGDNETLQSTVTNLKDEVASLRAILAAHASCPIAVANGERRGSQAYANGGQQSRF